MNQENKVVFRNALNGYNKNDVNEYITSLAKEFARRKDEWEVKATKLQNDLNTEASEKDALLEKYKKLTAENDVLTAGKKKAELELARLEQSRDTKQSAEALTAELAMEKAKLVSANTMLNSQHDAAIKHKKNAEALTAELTALKNKLAEKNTEIDALRKSLAEAERVSLERYAELAKQSGVTEGYIAQLKLMKEELDTKNKLLEAANKTSSDGSVSELRTEMTRFMTEFDEKLEDKLSGIAAKQAEAPKAEEPVKPAEASEKKSSVSDLHKKIDSFFGA